MRTSVGAFARIRRRGPGGDEWLTNWNDGWHALNLVGGHKHDDESFRDCCAREVAEELGLVAGADFRVAPWPARPWRNSKQKNLSEDSFDLRIVRRYNRLAAADGRRGRWIDAGAEGRRAAQWGLSPTEVFHESDAMDQTYAPRPLDVSAHPLPADLEALLERLAENAHEVWAARRLADGWTWGPARNDAERKHPCLVPYDRLPESEKEYDRAAARETLRAVLALGYRIIRP